VIFIVLSLFSRRSCHEVTDYDLSLSPPGIQKLATAAATNTNANTTQQ
jgi:hypothetical protein